MGEGAPVWGGPSGIRGIGTGPLTTGRLVVAVAAPPAAVVVPAAGLAAVVVVGPVAVVACSRGGGSSSPEDEINTEEQHSNADLSNIFFIAPEVSESITFKT